MGMRRMAVAVMVVIVMVMVRMIQKSALQAKPPGEDQNVIL